jgi:sugar lactone lactonase YvrE
MTTTTRTLYPTINRRDVLKGIGVTAGALSVGGGTMLFTGRAAAASGSVTETIYLSDSGQPGDTFGTRLFSVDLDDTASTATLTLLATGSDANYPKVDAVAASPDGATVYLFDKTTANLGAYDVSGGTLSTLGVVSFEDVGGNSIPVPDDTVLATFSPSGEFLLGAQGDDTVYTVDLGTLTASAAFTVSGADLSGADFAFDAAGTLFAYTNDGGRLYTVDTATGGATQVGTVGQTVTGMAIRDAGLGDLLVSSRTVGGLVALDPTTAAVGNTYQLVDTNGDPVPLGSGDMTVGRLAEVGEHGEARTYAVYQDGELLGCVEALSYTDESGGTVSLTDFYNYAASPNLGGSNTPTGLEEWGGSRVFLYEDDEGVALVFLHDDGSQNSSLGTASKSRQARFEFDGLPVGSGEDWIVDENNDVVDDTGDDQTFYWRWFPRWSDGGAYGYLECDFEVTVTPDFDPNPDGQAFPDLPASEPWLGDPADGLEGEATGAPGWTFLSGSAVAPTIALDPESDLVISCECPTCVDCESDELLAKFEFEGGEFAFEKGSDGDGFQFESSTDKPGETNEPITATFSTEYCSLLALVKAGPETIPQVVDAEDGVVTVTSTNGKAISNVQFYCTGSEVPEEPEEPGPPSGGRGSESRRPPEHGFPGARRRRDTRGRRGNARRGRRIGVRSRNPRR